MGYIGHKRSERSQSAIDRGLLTKTQLCAWQKRAIEAGAVLPLEWHHTGKYFSQTNYYDPKDFEQFSAKDFPPHKKKAKKENIWYVLVSAQWGGSKSYPRIIGAEIKVTNHVSSSQMDAKKYYKYGGYIKIFETEEEARKFAETAQLKKT